ncbi:MAG: UDP-N-acetylglucosamine 2-epimerase (hydrolyzing) [Proteobacteria bacterium]|nr:UDP-N-acetylglucosamine 2-epimerase (hydrolyzing) [Pseudomonadota bacterium]
MNRRICVVTGSRAEYGLLRWVLSDLRDAPDVDLQLVVTGMHLSPEFGSTVEEIEKDGFSIARRVDMLLSSGTASSVAKSIGLGVIGMSDALEQLKPDIVLLLGDRFEIFAAAQACLVHNIPIAHIAGGDTTEGAIDESMRHAITKMAHLHFVTNPESARRVRQLGESPDHIHVVGNPGLDHLKRQPLLDRAAVEKMLGAPLGRQNLLITFHPVTLEADFGAAQFAELLAALHSFDRSTKLWFTMPNADTGGRGMIATLKSWLEEHRDRDNLYASLGHSGYLSLMAQVDAVVGNSSSGLYEAPSLEVATVDIGNRQQGRLAAASVLHAAPDRAAILAAVERAVALDCSGIVNPYGDGCSSERIVETLQALPPASELIGKRFHMIGTANA